MTFQPKLLTAHNLYNSELFVNSYFSDHRYFYFCVFVFVCLCVKNHSFLIDCGMFESSKVYDCKFQLDANNFVN